ncbi:MAG: hypothetical protein IT186_12665 [Acidobacteria bacterium]|nr:hypothetical protein [Acidobacteriota bacterium]
MARFHPAAAAAVNREAGHYGSLETASTRAKTLATSWRLDAAQTAHATDVLSGVRPPLLTPEKAAAKFGSMRNPVRGQRWGDYWSDLNREASEMVDQFGPRLDQTAAIAYLVGDATYPIPPLFG